MSRITFNKLLYPKEIFEQCANEYKEVLKCEISEDNQYLIMEYCEEQREIMLEFGNYLIAMVRANGK